MLACPIAKGPLKYYNNLMNCVILYVLITDVTIKRISFLTTVFVFSFIFIERLKCLRIETYNYFTL